MSLCSLPPIPVNILHTAARANFQELKSDCMTPCLNPPQSSQSLGIRAKHLTMSLEGSRSFVPVYVFHFISLPSLTLMSPIIPQFSCLFWNTSSLTRPLGLCTCSTLCWKCPGPRSWPGFICHFKYLFKWHLQVLPLATESEWSSPPSLSIHSLAFFSVAPSTHVEPVEPVYM